MLTLLLLHCLIVPTLDAMALSKVESADDQSGADSRSILQAQCDELFEEFSSEARRYIEGTHRAKTVEDAREFSRPNGTEYAARFMKIARDHPESPVAADALTKAILVDFAGPHWKEAIRLIRLNHVESPKIGPALASIAMDSTPPAVEPLLRSVLEENPAADVRAWAALALSQHLRRLAGEAENLRRYPERFERAASEFGLEETTRMRDRDPGLLRRESEKLLELVVEKYAAVAGTGGPSPAEVAAEELYSIRELAVGKPAPEIEGTDINGRPMRLSDFRGKIVALVWWATWCGPCMGMVSHERELIRRMEGRPFVLLGVNGDEDKGRLEYQMKERGIDWRSWYEGGPDGPISRRWNIKAWPTVFVLDSEGVIRYKGGRNVEDLDEAVEELLDEANNLKRDE